jgi:hypothetical protein
MNILLCYETDSKQTKNPDKIQTCLCLLKKGFGKESANSKVSYVCSKRRSLGKKPTVWPQG